VTQTPPLQLHTLSNGLQVYTMEVQRAPVVNFMVWYNVGSRHEGPGKTGMSHFLEHMMFKGTAAFPNGAIEDAVRDRGGMWNAFTWVDYTAYFEVLPSRHAELAVAIEADRMQNMFFDRDLTVRERGIIVSEREGSENRPRTWLLEGMMQTAYTQFPYRHPVIGWKDDIKATTAEALTDHYRRYYRPNNAAAVAVGDFRTDEMLRLVERHFGPLPAGEPVHDIAAVEPEQTEERRVVVRRPSPTPYLYVAWKTPPAGHRDLPALDLLGAVLSGAPSMEIWGGGAALGRSSRLYRRMVEGGLTADASTGTFDTKHPGLFLASFTVKPDVDPARVEEALYEEIGRLQNDLMPADEFERALKQMRAQYTYSLESVFSLGIHVGSSWTRTGTPDTFIRYLEHLEALTPEDLRRVAATYLTPERRTVGTLLPDTAEQTPPAPAGPPPGAEPEEGTTPDYQQRTGHAQPAVEIRPLPAEEKVLLDPDRVIRREMPEGWTLLVYPIAGMKSASIRLSLEAGAICDPPEKAGLANLTAQLLTRGTERYSAEALARKTDSLGMSLSVDGGRESVLGHIRCLPEDLQTGIELLGEVIRRPSFPEEEVVRNRERLLVRVREATNSTQAVADKKLSELLYPEGHPFRLPVIGEEETLSRLAREDLAAFHARHFRPAGALAVVVGDVDPARVEEAFAAHFGDWRGAAAPPAVNLVQAPAEPVREHVTVPGKSQADIAMGWALVDRSHPDYLPIEMLAIVLGRVGTGTSIGRLFRDVREKHGLSYYQYCSFSPARGPSSWSIHIGVSPARLDFAIDVLKREVGRLRDEPLPDTERKPLLAYIEGSQSLRLESGENIASLLTMMARFDLGFDYLQRYPKLLAAITSEQLQESARRYLDLDRLTVVTAGPELG
jgi:zinc protease